MRGMGKLAVALILAAGAAAGQWVDKVVTLPDSLSGVESPEYLLYCSVENVVYVGGGLGECLLALEGGSGDKVARVPLHGTVRALSYNEAEGKVYCSTTLWDGLPDSVRDTLYVVEAATGLVAGALDVSVGPSTLCQNPAVNKLYCTSARDSCVSVFDCGVDTLVAEVVIGANPGVLDCNVGANKVYCFDGSLAEIAVVDGAGDSILSRIELPGSEDIFDGLHVESRGKLYCADYGQDRVAVVDSDADTLMCWVDVGRRPLHLCYNPRDEKLYVSSAGGLDIVCGLGDTAIAHLGQAGDGGPLAYDSLYDVVYCAAASDDEVLVVDGAGDSLLAPIAVGDSPGGLCHAPGPNRLFVGNTLSHDVSVVECPAHTVVQTVRMWCLRLGAACWNPVMDRFYCAGSPYGMAAVDVAAARVVHLIPGVSHGKRIVYQLPENKVYVAPWSPVPQYRHLEVVDCSSDSVVAIIDVPFEPLELCSNPDRNKLYCGPVFGDSIAVVDCSADTLVKLLAVGGGLCPTMLYVPPEEELFVSTMDGLVAIDAAADSVVRVVLNQRVSTPLYIPRENEIAVWRSECGVIAIDASSCQVRDTVELDSIMDMLYNNIDNTLYVATGSPSRIEVIDCGEWQVVDTVPLDSSLLAGFDSLANRIWCIGMGPPAPAPALDRVISVIDCGTNQVVAELVADDIGFPLWSPTSRSLYFPMANHSAYLVVKDTTLVGVEEMSNVEVRMRDLPTVVRGVLRIEDSRQHSAFRAELLDCAGRKVLELHPGENDVGHLSPGVYFCREQGPRVRKVVVAR